jgi:hypothetical protein
MIKIINIFLLFLEKKTAILTYKTKKKFDINNQIDDLFIYFTYTTLFIKFKFFQNI